MTRRHDLEDNYIVETFLYSDSENISTAVEITLMGEAFENKNFTTSYFNVHGNEVCDCINAQHLTRFALRMRTREWGVYKCVDLHLSGDLVKPLTPACMIKTGPETLVYANASYKVIKFVGWQFLGTLFSRYSGSHPYRTKFNVIADKGLTEIPSIPAKEHTLSNNLLQLLSDGKYSDVTLLSEEGKAFNVHKAILEKRSEVFRANFQHNTNVNSIKTVLREEILHQMLVYIYSDTHPAPADITTDLLRAADYYQLLGLKTICTAVLCSHLKVENAVTTLELAVQHDCKEMIKFIICYIKQNRDLVTQTEDWKNLSSVETIKVIFENGL